MDGDGTAEEMWECLWAHVEEPYTDDGEEGVKCFERQLGGDRDDENEDRLLIERSGCNLMCIGWVVDRCHCYCTIR